MKVLLDENLPQKLRNDLEGHEVYTVFFKRWNGIKNGELLKLMQEEGFYVLLTCDKNIKSQQNFKTYPLSVLVIDIPDNTYLTLRACSGFLSH